MRALKEEILRLEPEKIDKDIIKNLVPITMPEGFLGYSKFLNEVERGSWIKRDDLFVRGPPIMVASKDILDWIINNFKGKSLLDCGCGAGAYVKALNELGYDCIGLDIDCETLKVAKSHFRIEVVNGNAINLPFKNKSFDGVLLIETIEHIENPIKVLLEAKRVARKQIFLTTPNLDCLPYLASFHVVPHHLLDPTHVSLFTKKSLEGVLSMYFDEFEVEPFGRIFPFVDDPPLYYNLRAIIYL